MTLRVGDHRDPRLASQRQPRSRSRTRSRSRVRSRPSSADPGQHHQDHDSYFSLRLPRASGGSGAGTPTSSHYNYGFTRGLTSRASSPSSYRYHDRNLAFDEREKGYFLRGNNDDKGHYNYDFGSEGRLPRSVPRYGVSKYHEDRRRSNSEDEIATSSESDDDDDYNDDDDDDDYVYSDEDGEALLYGDLSPARKNKIDAHDRFVPPPGSSRSRSPIETPVPVPGSFPSDHGGQDPYTRHVPTSNSSATRPVFGTTTAAPPGPSSTSRAWDPISERGLPSFVPPSSYKSGGGQSIPGAFPVTQQPDKPTAAPSPPTPALASTYSMPKYATSEQLRQQQRLYAQIPPTTSNVDKPLYAPSPVIPSSPTKRNPLGEKRLYANLPQWQYAKIDPSTVRYATSKPAAKPSSRPTSSSSQQPYMMSGAIQDTGATSPGRTSGHRPSRSTSSAMPNTTGHNVPSVRPSLSDRRTASTGHRPTLSLPTSNNLSVFDGTSKGRPPASPLLEPYKGTWQSISPMPSPIVVPPKLDDDDLSAANINTESDSERLRRRQRSVSTIGLTAEMSERERYGRSRSQQRRPQSPGYTINRYGYGHDSQLRRRSRSRGANVSPGRVRVASPSTRRKKVSFYDPVPDARAISQALCHRVNIETQPIIRILPHLTNDEIQALRREYKHIVRERGKGVNIAKHLKVKLGSSPFGKACYATALGRFASEAYWANCYYQSSTSRRELLIESLMGRTNAQIREIKDCFRDVRYADSLERCMRVELNADKFRTAILLALEGRRQSEHEPLDWGLVERDMRDLRAALVTRDGGETAMIYIVVLRSDSHLREVMRMYDRKYGQHFVRAMIAKSNNLVVSFIASFHSCWPRIKKNIFSSERTKQTNPPTGRSPSTHPQRRHKPAHARCPPPPPGTPRITNRPRTLGAARVAAGAATLGTPASGAC